MNTHRPPPLRLLEKRARPARDHAAPPAPSWWERWLGLVPPPRR